MKLRSMDYFPRETRRSPEGGGIHDCYEILCIRQGQAEIGWLGETYHINGNACFLLSPNTPHRLKKVDTQLRYYYVEFELSDASAFPALPQLLQWNGMQEQFSNREDYSLLLASLESLEQLVHAWVDHQAPLLEESLVYELRKMICMVKYFLDNRKCNDGATDTVEQSQVRTIESLKRYMEAYYTEDLSLRALTDLVHLNSSYLIRLFKRLEGRTPMQYLSDLRINAAISYLKNSDMSIQEIAKASGYHSIHYFSRAFKQKFGQSPSAWRGVFQPQRL